MKYNTLYSVILFMALIVPGYTTCAQQIRLKMGEQIIVTSDGIKLAIKVAGKGPVCIYIHGGPGQDYLSFEKMGGSNLEKKLTMVYLDQRGSGHSQNAKDYSLNRLVNDIEETRKQLGAGKIYLLSHSFGGVLVVNYAQKYQEHVSGLILANSTLHFFNNSSLREQIMYSYRLLHKDTIITSDNTQVLLRQNSIVRKKLNKVHLGYKLLADSVNTIEKMDSIESSYKRTSDFGYAVIAHLIDTTKQNRYPEYWKDYATISSQIHVPVLVITGTRDYAIGTAHYKTFRFPDQHVMKLDGSHMLYYEKNAAFTAAVFRFICKQSE
ncbi:alpha/beta fold hydrolase [Mucilaginibacter sp. NFX135]|uniref:alpha/beta fold hydrolase n=1 Tax=Mucilaginibacter sp. NFX135 TaxID=3402687 RepID=UPI003AFB4E0B